MNLTDDPLEFSLPPDNRVDEIVDEFLTADVLFSYGIADWLTLHFDLPFNLYSNVEPIANFQSSEDASFGDLRFSATLNLYRTWDDVDPSIQRSGVALIPFFTFPMDNTDDFFGDGSWTGGGLLAFDRHMGKRHYIGLNLGAKYRREQETILNLTVGHEALASATYVYRILCKHKLDFLAEIQGSTTFDEFLSEEISSPVEVFAGLRKQSKSEHWEWTIGAGRGINNGYGAPDFHLFTGVSYLFFNKTKPRSHCCSPVQPPEAVAPTEQPRVEVPLGSIHIEIVNSNGVPVVLPIYIYKNNVPFVHNQTNRIKQPIETGTYRVEIAGMNKIVETIEVLPSQETYKKIIIPVAAPLQAIVRYVEPIYFDSNKDTIKLESFSALDQVYSIIQEYPDIQWIQIEAHTDSQGKDAYNLDLSNRRATSARNYLVEKGVDSARIKTMGFGEVRPIDTNETAQGRSKNRRVEFLIHSPNQQIKIIQKN